MRVVYTGVLQYTGMRYVPVVYGGLTVYLAAEVLRASGVLADGGVSVVHQDVVFGALEVRTDFI